MGPRADARGNAISTVDSDDMAELQWGRELMPAETIRTDVCSCGAIRLQWGRELMPAETARPRRNSRTPDPLQWGRELMPAETFHTQLKGQEK